MSSWPSLRRLREVGPVSQLVTGEAVALHLRPARLASRIVARFLDLAIETAALLMLLWMFGSSGLSFGDADFALALLIVVVAMYLVGYPVAWEALWRGRTPGKAIMGLRVVRNDGGPIRFRHALARGLFNIVDLWLTFGSAGMIVSLLSERGRRLGDIIAGTFVLQERMPKQHVAPVLMPHQLAAWAATLDLSRMPDDLALAVRGFLGRASQLRPEARDRLGTDLTAAVAACVSPAPPAGTPGWAYLSAVVAERRRREEARMPRGAGVPGVAGVGPTPWQPAPPSAGWSGSPAGSAYPGAAAGVGAGAGGWPGAPGGPGAAGGVPGVPGGVPGAGGGVPPGPAPWAASAPPTGAPPEVGPPPPWSAPPHDPGPPRLPHAPSPQWGPHPVPPSPPPARGAPASGAPASGAPVPVPAPPTVTADAEPATPPEPAPPDGFAVPG
jgi:uncharacterized RDD family membrane protein YckC